MADYDDLTPSGVDYTDGVLYGRRWQDMPVTFAFPEESANYPIGDTPGGFVELNDNCKNVFREAYADMSRICGMTVAEVTPSAGVETVAVCKHAFGTVGGGAAAATTGVSSATEGAGDTILRDSYAATNYANPLPGFIYHKFIWHEAGHSVGLDHAHEDALNSFTAMDSSLNAFSNTIMSYRWKIGGSDTNTGGDLSYSAPQSYMKYDQAGLVYMHGQGPGYSGDTTYSFNASTGQHTAGGVTYTAPAGNKVFKCLIGCSGVETIDTSNYSTGGTYNLNYGEWSTISSTQLALIDTGASTYAAGNFCVPLEECGWIFDKLKPCQTASNTILFNTDGTANTLILTGNRSAYTETGASRDWVISDGTYDHDCTDLDYVQYADGTIASGDLGAPTELTVLRLLLR